MMFYKYQSNGSQADRYTHKMVIPCRGDGVALNKFSIDSCDSILVTKH